MTREIHRTIIRWDSPVARRRRRIGVALVLIAALTGAYYAGSQQALYYRLPYDYSSDALRTRAIALETQLAIDNQTLEQLRGELLISQGNIEELERELAFYRGVIAPEERITGVLLRPPALRATELPGVYAYELVVQQGTQTTVSGKRVYQGGLQVTILGQQDGQPEILPLESIDDALGTASIELSFRYFQRWQGQITLPPGFEPEEMSVEVVMTTPEKQSVDYNYRWEDLLKSDIPEDST